MAAEHIVSSPAATSSMIMNEQDVLHTPGHGSPEYKGPAVATVVREPGLDIVPDGGYPWAPYGGMPREIQIIAPASQFRRFGNAAALGLITFGICTVQESMMQTGMSVGYGRGYGSMTGQSLAVAGIAQLLAGLWQIANGDTFEGAAFSSFGASWLAKGLAQVPGTGVIAYQQTESAEVVRRQQGIIALTWSIWVLILLAGNVKSHIANIVMFSTLNLQLDFSCAGTWLGHERLTKAGGWFGFFCGLSAMYNAAAILLNEENFWFNLPVGNWYTPKAVDDEEAGGQLYGVPP